MYSSNGISAVLTTLAVPLPPPPRPSFTHKPPHLPRSPLTPLLTLSPAVFTPRANYERCYEESRARGKFSNSYLECQGQVLETIMWQLLPP